MEQKTLKKMGKTEHHPTKGGRRMLWGPLKSQHDQGRVHAREGKLGFEVRECTRWEVENNKCQGECWAKRDLAGNRWVKG